MEVEKGEVFGFLKAGVDAHTLGIRGVGQLLEECGFQVLIAGKDIEEAIDDISFFKKRKIVIDWIRENGITRLGISYRLDPADGEKIVGYLLTELKKEAMLNFQRGIIRGLYFAGLPETCRRISQQWGEETNHETLTLMGIPADRIPDNLTRGCQYDYQRREFARELIKEGGYNYMSPPDKASYPSFGTERDSLNDRIQYQLLRKRGPLMRAHAGPYYSHKKKEDSVKEFIQWAKDLSASGYLDILSIGSSQLTQSDFGGDWDGKPNGGGVPINSASEYHEIWEAARPMLVRTYAGTKNIRELAEIHEKSLHICWHAMSLWWFNKLDGRGPYSLLESLQQQFFAMEYIAKKGTPFEANVAHHFAFRGGDDVTYIVSSFLAAKLAKKMGIRTLILQNMLNTPKNTWGIQDLAKSRALLFLIGKLRDKNFNFFLQPRAGLDYLRPNPDDAKSQLAEVTALMDDIEPDKENSPPLIHVVAYSEASHLATPEIIDESIKITSYSLNKYRELRRKDEIGNMASDPEVRVRTGDLINAAMKIITIIEETVENPYTPQGFYRIFKAGFLPVPYLWNPGEEFRHSTFWKSKWINGGIKIVDEAGMAVGVREIGERAKENLLNSVISG